MFPKMVVCLDPLERGRAAASRDTIFLPKFTAFAGRHILMAKQNPVEFLREVRSEALKVAWPTRKETMITTAMVFVMVILASIFFLLSDQVLRWVVGLVLGIGR